MTQTIDFVDVVKATAKSSKKPEMLVHLQLQQHAQRMGINVTGTRMFPVSEMNELVASAKARFNWK